MLKNNKFLIISIVLGTMFFNISSSAMESNNHGKKQENLNEDNILKIQSDEEKEIEELRKLGYGDTKQEQKETKEWIEKWGLNNEEVYSKMKKKNIKI